MSTNRFVNRYENRLENRLVNRLAGSGWLVPLAVAGCAEPSGRDLGEVPASPTGKSDDPAAPEAEDAHALLCEDAYVQLLDCTGTVDPDFHDACLADRSSQAVAVLDAIVAAECAPADSGEDAGGDAPGDEALTADAFASVCAPAIMAGALINQFRNRDRGGPMPAAMKETLRPYYGTLVDEAVVYYDATIVNEWEIAGRPIRIGFEVAGQTLGHRIYISRSERPGQERLMAHEMAHFKQSRCLAEDETGRFGLARFAYRYCKELYFADFQYSPHRLEVGANLVENEIMGCHFADECQAAPVECVDACTGAACDEDLVPEP